MVKHESSYKEFKIRLKNGGHRVRTEDVNLFLQKKIVSAIKRQVVNKGKKSVSEPKKYLQNSVVKVSYTEKHNSKNWTSHAKYLVREGAQIEGRKGVAFDEKKEETDIVERVRTWADEGDERMWRVILSPEQGERMNLREHTRNLMKKVEADLNIKLDWVAIEHFNTDNPHIHIVIRGKGIEGQKFRIDKDYIKSGMRVRSREVATQKLGVRLRSDVLARRQKAISQNRFTELDRELLRLSQNATCLICFAGSLPQNKFETENRLHLIGRLQYLQSLELVQRKGNLSWEISKDLEPTLRTFQITNDIVKRKAQHIGVISDPNMPLVYTQLKTGEQLIGRVVGFGIHREDKMSQYMMIEGVDGKIHYTHPKMQMLKERSELKIRNGDVLYLEVKSFYKNNQKVTYLSYENFGNVKNLKSIQGISKADEYVNRELEANRNLFEVTYPDKTFRAKFYSVMKERITNLKQSGALEEKRRITKELEI